MIPPSSKLTSSPHVSLPPHTSIQTVHSFFSLLEPFIFRSSTPEGGDNLTELCEASREEKAGLGRRREELYLVLIAEEMLV